MYGGVVHGPQAAAERVTDLARRGPGSRLMCVASDRVSDAMPLTCSDTGRSNDVLTPATQPCVASGNGHHGPPAARLSLRPLVDLPATAATWSPGSASPSPPPRGRDPVRAGVATLATVTVTGLILNTTYSLTVAAVKRTAKLMRLAPTDRPSSACPDW
jgi:hypothetical protein